MRKLIVGILTVMCLLTLAACGGTPSASDAGSDKDSGSNKESNYPEKSLNFLVPTGALHGVER
jgi:hypothetical protein